MTSVGKAGSNLLLYFQPRPIAAFLLGIASGFPLTLLLATMTYWLSKVGVDKKTIGFAVGLTTPYTLKFLWAPLIDRWRLPILSGLIGHRRSWLVLTGVLLAIAVIMLGRSDPVNDLGGFALWAVATAFLSATQDIVIDAYRIEILPDEQLAYGTAMNQFGYRVGSALIGGALVVWLASPEGASLGWAGAYGLSTLCILAGWAAALWCGETRKERPLENWSFARWMSTAVAGPFREFFSRRGALLILLFIMIYKIGDAMGQIMLSPMIVELGFTDTEYIAANKAVGFWALIAGTAVGPMFLSWAGMGRGLFWSGVLMMASNLGFTALALLGHQPWALGVAVGIENFTSGLGLTVFATYLSGLTNASFTATQYALLSSLAAVGRTFLSTPSGYLAEGFGWPGFYLFTTLAALPGLLLLWLIWRSGIVSAAIRAQ